MPKAAAERKMAPMFVVSTTPSITAMRWAFRQTSSTGFGIGRRMAHSTPRVKVYPVSDDRSSRSPVYIGMSPHRSTMDAASPLMCFRSHNNAKGSYPAFSATWITFGLSAMKMPFDGSKRFRNWASVRVAKTSTPGWLSEVISMMGITFLYVILSLFKQFNVVETWAKFSLLNLVDDFDNAIVHWGGASYFPAEFGYSTIDGINFC